jgi:hypothetical protein
MNNTKLGKRYRDTQCISDWFERDYEVLGSPETIALNKKVNGCLENEGLECCSKYACPKDRLCFCDAFMERERSVVKDLERALNLPLSTGLATVILDAVEFYLKEQFDQRPEPERSRRRGGRASMSDNEDIKEEITLDEFEEVIIFAREAKNDTDECNGFFPDKCQQCQRYAMCRVEYIYHVPCPELEDSNRCAKGEAGLPINCHVCEERIRSCDARFPTLKRRDMSEAAEKASREFQDMYDAKFDGINDAREHGVR